MLLREPPRHRSAAVIWTTSRRWRGRPKFDFHSGRLTQDVKKDEQEDRDTIVACGAARRRRQRRPDVVLDSTPRRSKAASVSLPSRRWRKARRAQGSRRRPTGLCAWRARRRSSCPRRRRRPRRCWTGSRATRSSRTPGPVVVAGGGGGFCDVLCFDYEVFCDFVNRSTSRNHNQQILLSSTPRAARTPRRGGLAGPEGEASMQKSA